MKNTTPLKTKQSTLEGYFTPVKVQLTPITKIIEKEVSPKSDTLKDLKSQKQSQNENPIEQQL